MSFSGLLPISQAEEVLRKSENSLSSSEESSASAAMPSQSLRASQCPMVGRTYFNIYQVPTQFEQSIMDLYEISLQSARVLQAVAEDKGVTIFTLAGYPE